MKKRLPATDLYRQTKDNPPAGNTPSAGMLPSVGILPPGTKSGQNVPQPGKIATPGTKSRHSVPQPRKIATPGTKSRHSVPQQEEIATPGTKSRHSVPQPRKIATPGTKLPQNVPQLQKKHIPGTKLPQNVPYTKMISFVGKGVLFDYAQLLANLCECGNCLVQMLPLVSGRDLNTDAGLVLRNYRVVETYYINTLVQKFLGHLL